MTTTDLRKEYSTPQQDESPAPSSKAPKQAPSTKEKAKAASAAAPPEHLPADLQKHLKAGAWSIPHKGFIRDYLNWAVPRTEAPLGFHLAAVIVGLAIVLARKCEIQVGDLTFYPNTYAVCVGESTLVRKSHSINMLRRVLEKVEKKLKLEHGFFLADDGSPEGFLVELREKQRGVRVFNEFGNFQRQTKKRDYLGGFPGLFTELYDCPNTYRKQLSQSAFQIERPFLCLLGATTREWLVDGMDESDIRGGYLARFLLFPGKEEPELIPITPPRNEETEEQLAQQLAELSKISGAFEPTEKAKKVYSDWYIKHREELKQPGMGLLSAYYGRLEGYVWKIAFIFEATTKPKLQSISEASTQLAIQFVERLKKDLKPLIQNELQPNPLAKLLERVRRMIHKAGPRITRTQLLENSHLTSRQLDMVIKTLEEREEIEHESVKRVGGTVTVYKAR
ncbi:YfjI family protein [Acidobacteria bacterium AH-259-O06]|nr:YfjI family protein [Acidobacteria bacterium AH-259-O06]